MFSMNLITYKISYSSGCKKSKTCFAVYSQGLSRVDPFQILRGRICFLSFYSFWKPLGFHGLRLPLESLQHFTSTTMAPSSYGVKYFSDSLL